MRRGMDMGFMVKLVLWIAILILVFFIIRRFIVGAGGEVTGPLDWLIS